MSKISTSLLAFALLLACSTCWGQQFDFAPSADDGAAAATAPDQPPRLPLVASSSAAQYQPKPLTFAQQAARFEAEQRLLRLQWNKWIGYSPLRPNMNANYMSNGLQRYYIPSRGLVISGTNSRTWYW